MILMVSSYCSMRREPLGVTARAVIWYTGAFAPQSAAAVTSSCEPFQQTRLPFCKPSTEELRESCIAAAGRGARGPTAARAGAAEFLADFIVGVVAPCKVRRSDGLPIQRVGDVEHAVCST